MIEFDPVVQPPIPKRLLVVGCPRSGTQFFCNLLQIFGMRVNHERMGEDGMVNAAWLAESQVNDKLIRIKGRQHYEFGRILHLIRHPVPCIESMSRELPETWWTWQEAHSNLHIDDPRDLEMMAAFWIFWTDGCQHLCDKHIRLEDVAHIGDRTNKGRHPAKPITLNNLGSCAGEVEKRMETYGYKS